MIIQLTAGETSVDQRITLATNALKNALVAHGERNARVLAAAVMTLMQHNPDLAHQFEELCGSLTVKLGLATARREQGR